MCANILAQEYVLLKIEGELMVIIKLYEEQINFYYTHYVLNVQLRPIIVRVRKIRNIIQCHDYYVRMYNTLIYLLMQQYQYLVSLVSYSI